MIIKIAVVFGSLLALLALPFAFRPAGVADPANAARLVVVTPHNEQIRYEFGRAFSVWHEREHGVPVVIDWRVPGGTSEIRRLLEAQYTRAIRTGHIVEGQPAPVGLMPYDLLFGGGAYDHGLIKRGVSVVMDQGGEGVRSVSRPMSVRIAFDEATLYEWFGENRIGVGALYDPDGYWFGSALTAFGIVYSREALDRLGLPEPASWEALTDPRYTGWLAMTDPRQSGSVTTSYDSILNSYGWDKGWRILRGMAANARSFVDSSQKAPIEVSANNAAAGPSIGFYGRYQSQSLLRPGQEAHESPVGYIDPPGMVFIDSDPISILDGGPNPEIARRFLEFTLTEEGQALWQYRRVDADAPVDAWGPRRFELRRMPIRRVMYEDHHARRFVDTLDPFNVVSDHPSRGWRGMIEILMGTFAIDIHADMRRAWIAMHEAHARGEDPALLARMDELFYAMPVHVFPDGREVLLTEDTYDDVRADWRTPGRAPELRIAYTNFFRANYREVARLARTGALRE
ncbi:MAG: extracellular solute-binding protein [Phycisphaerales bacterium]|nr:MAG: extracellular solute-binding protein [Phycisphaerales bacterium]